MLCIFYKKGGGPRWKSQGRIKSLDQLSACFLPSIPQTQTLPAPTSAHFNRPFFSFGPPWCFSQFCSMMYHACINVYIHVLYTISTCMCDVAFRYSKQHTDWRCWLKKRQAHHEHLNHQWGGTPPPVHKLAEGTSECLNVPCALNTYLSNFYL